MSKIASKAALKRAIRYNSAGLRQLPEWNLDDLYSGLDDPAIKRDLDRTDAECTAFEEAYKGKLADLAQTTHGGDDLAAVARRYEAIDNLIGRLSSFAGLTPAATTLNPARTKLYGDMQARPTAPSIQLRFFTL